MTRAPRLTPAQRRASIVAATTELIRTHGPHVNTKQIAKAAGIAEGTIFRVFQSLNDVLIETVQVALSPEALTELLEDQEFSGHLEEDLTTAISMVSNYFARVQAMVHINPEVFKHFSRDRHCAKDSWADRNRQILAFLETVFAPHADQLRIDVSTFSSLVLLTAAGNYSHTYLNVESIPIQELATIILIGTTRCS